MDNNTVIFIDTDKTTISDFVDDWAACFHAPARPDTAEKIRAYAIGRFGQEAWDAERESRV